MKKSVISCLSVAALLLAAAPAARAADNSYLVLGAGYTGIFNDHNAGQFRLEYRPADSLFWQIKPLVGFQISTKGGTYTFAGVHYDWGIAPNWYVIPSLAVGLYEHGGDKGLGSIVEFRSQLEGAYEFDSGDRLGLAVSHMSNAGIGNHNPGTEAIVAEYHLPLWRLVGDSQ